MDGHALQQRCIAMELTRLRSFFMAYSIEVWGLGEFFYLVFINFPLKRQLTVFGLNSRCLRRRPSWYDRSLHWAFRTMKQCQWWWNSLTTYMNRMEALFQSYRSVFAMGIWRLCVWRLTAHKSFQGHRRRSMLTIVQLTRTRLGKTFGWGTCRCFQEVTKLLNQEIWSQFVWWTSSAHLAGFPKLFRMDMSLVRAWQNLAHCAKNVHLLGPLLDPHRMEHRLLLTSSSLHGKLCMTLTEFNISFTACWYIVVSRSRTTFCITYLRLFWRMLPSCKRDEEGCLIHVVWSAQWNESGREQYCHNVPWWPHQALFSNDLGCMAMTATSSLMEGEWKQEAFYPSFLVHNWRLSWLPMPHRLKTIQVSLRLQLFKMLMKLQCGKSEVPRPSNVISTEQPSSNKRFGRPDQIMPLLRTLMHLSHFVRGMQQDNWLSAGQ